MAAITSAFPFSAPGWSHCIDLVTRVLHVGNSSKHKALGAFGRSRVLCGLLLPGLDFIGWMVLLSSVPHRQKRLSDPPLHDRGLLSALSTTAILLLCCYRSSFL